MSFACVVCRCVVCDVSRHALKLGLFAGMADRASLGSQDVEQGAASDSRHCAVAGGLARHRNLCAGTARTRPHEHAAHRRVRRSLLCGACVSRRVRLPRAHRRAQGRKESDKVCPSGERHLQMSQHACSVVLALLQCCHMRCFAVSVRVCVCSCMCVCSLVALLPQCSSRAPSC
jgi:hypothetical protein